MGKLLPDPELERLVHEMNTIGDGRERPTEDEPEPLRSLELSAIVAPEPDGALQGILLEMLRRRGSDLLLVPGAPPVVRVDGDLVALDRPPIGLDTVRILLGPQIGGRARQQLAERGSTEFSLRLAGGEIADNAAGWRLRISIQRLYNELLTGRQHGMVTMEESLATLVGRGLVSAEDARMRAANEPELERRLAT